MRQNLSRKISADETLDFLLITGFLIIITMLLVNHDIFSQDNRQNVTKERWVDPRFSVPYPAGNYFPLPQYPDNYVHANKAPRTVITPIGTFVVNPNFRVHPNTVTQSEVIITRNPRNQNIL